MEQYEIREVSEKQLEICAAIIREGFGTVARDFGLTPENCPSNGAFLQTERLRTDLEKGNLMYGLFQNSTLIGFYELEKLKDNVYALEKITVLPAFRHNGLGKRLLDAVKENVRKLGGCKISIGIIEENTVLKNWYIANGFVPTGTRKFEHLPFTVGFMEYAVTEVSHE